MTKKTKIVATIGPASNSYETLKALGEAGVNIFRLNFSHGEYAWHQDLIDKIKKLRADTGIYYAMMLDTKGPEVRTGMVPEPIMLEEGSEIVLTISDEPYEKNKKIKISYPEFINDVKVGDKLLVDSGVVTLVIDKKTDTDIFCHSMDEGQITSKRHINIPGAHISLPAITDRDWEDLEFGIKNDIDFVAMSFVREAKEVKEMKAFLGKKGSHAQVIAKIETGESVTNLDEIVAASDGLMVARGDLGAEIPLSQVPIIQHKIITKSQAALKPVIVATQMLESMSEHPVPTRAEVTDVFHAVSDQTDAIMLSGETASGEYPVKTVKMMTSIAAEAEEMIIHKTRTLKAEESEDIQYELAKLSVQMCEDMPNIAGILVVTKSGNMAKKVSHFRPDAPIYAYTDDPKTMTHMQIMWGVLPTFGIFDNEDPEATISTAIKTITEEDPELKNSKIILISDSLVGKERVPMIQVRTV